MFTGIIEETGRILRISTERNNARIEVKTKKLTADVLLGESISVNGICLTIIDRGPDWFVAQISTETLRRTSLKSASNGSLVNLERPLTSTSRLGGHFVQGHVDGTGEFLEAAADGEGRVIRIGFPQELGRYIVEKGSIAVDGISLTVASLCESWFEIAVIPHTWKVTNLSSLDRGDLVNLEVDVLAKYVERMIRPHLNGHRL
jgi:riboflavin synthase